MDRAAIAYRDRIRHGCGLVCHRFICFDHASVATEFGKCDSPSASASRLRCHCEFKLGWWNCGFCWHASQRGWTIFGPKEQARCANCDDCNFSCRHDRDCNPLQALMFSIGYSQYLVLVDTWLIPAEAQAAARIPVRRFRPPIASGTPKENRFS